MVLNIQLDANETMNVHWLKLVLEENQKNAKTHVDTSNVESMQNVRSKTIEQDVFAHLNTLEIHTEDADPTSACPTLTVQPL